MPFAHGQEIDKTWVLGAQSRRQETGALSQLFVIL